MAKSPTPKKQVRFSSTDLKQLKDLLRAPQSRLRWYYEVGKQIKKLVPRYARKNGKDKMEALAKRVAGRKNFRNFLYPVREFALKYRPEELVELKKKKLKWTHVRFLLTVDDDKRARMQRRLLQNPSWSVRRLRLEILARQPKRSQGRRRPRKVGAFGPETALRETVYLSQKWLRSCPVWIRGNSKKLAAVAKQDTNGKLFDSAIAKLGKIEQAANELREELQNLRDRPKTIRHNRR